MSNINKIDILKQITEINAEIVSYIVKPRNNSRNQRRTNHHHTNTVVRVSTGLSQKDTHINQKN